MNGGSILPRVSRRVASRATRGVALAAVLAANGLIARAADSAFIVGVLRRDALVVPFASFDGKKWHGDWPEPRADVEVPIDLASVPKRWWGALGARDVWQAWLGPSATRTLRVVRPHWFEAHCARQIGLKTDYQTADRLPPPRTRPYPKDGLAVSPARPIEPIETIAPGEIERFLLGLAVTNVFNKTERDIARESDHPVLRRDREKNAPVIEAMYAYGAGPRLFYVEAAREYRSPGDPGGACRAVAFGGGWFMRGGDHEYTPIGTYVMVQDCDRPAASFMLPLGVVRVEGKTYWLAQFSGWHGEQYEVLEFKSKAVERIVSRSGGGC
jgi:hypothetical protein